MTRMHIPPRWHYDFIRALDYFQNINASRDEHITNSIELLTSKKGKDGHWQAYSIWAGRTYFMINERVKS